MKLGCRWKQLWGVCPLEELTRQQASIHLNKARIQFVRAEREKLEAVLVKGRMDELLKMPRKYYDGYWWEEQESLQERNCLFSVQEKDCNREKRDKCLYEKGHCEGRRLLQESCMVFMRRRLQEEADRLNELNLLIDEIVAYHKKTEVEERNVLFSYLNGENASLLYTAQISLIKTGSCEAFLFWRSEQTYIKRVTFYVEEDSHLLDRTGLRLKGSYAAIKINGSGLETAEEVLQLYAHVQQLVREINKCCCKLEKMLRVIYLSLVELTPYLQKEVMRRRSEVNGRIIGTVDQKGNFHKNQWLISIRN